MPGIAVIEDDPRITRRAYHLFCFRLDQGRLGVTDDERHDVSLHAAARIMCGIGAFFLFLLLS
jgi:hypothetical protein